MTFSDIKGNLSVLKMHYLLGEKGKGIKHFEEKIESGLFEVNETLRIMKDVGFEAKYLKKGLMSGRGLYIGVKK